MVSVLSDNGKVDIAVFNKAIEELPFSSNNNGADENNSIPKVSSLRKIEEEQIRYVYKKHNGNLSKIREELGISRTTLWKRLKELGITE